MTDDLTLDSLVNRGEYLSAHYLAAVLPRELKRGTLARWRDDEKAGRDTPRTGLRSLRRAFFADRLALSEDAERYNAAPRTGPSTSRDTSTHTGTDAARAGNGYPAWRKTLSGLHTEVLRSLGFSPVAQHVTVVRGGAEHAVPVAHAEAHIVAAECGWAVDVDAALDPRAAGRLLEPVPLDAREVVATGADLASFLFGAEDPPRYVLILAGGVVILADRTEWGEGRFLGVSLDTALGRNDARPGGELDVVAALFGADSLRPPAEGGAEPLADLVAASHQHAVGVSAELRQGLQESVELIANEVLARIREAGVEPEEITDTGDLARQLTRESLRYLYRILFLLYAEARPDLGILPADYDEYVEGYGLARLGELVTQPLLGEEAGRGFHLYESLDLLFRLVNKGHRPRGGPAGGPREADATAPDDSAAETLVSEGEGIRFEPLRSNLFEPGAIRLIGRDTLEDPRHDDPADDGGGARPRFLDTRLRNQTLYRVLRLLMLRKGKKGERGGFVSYAQLGINQLGAVYEGLMSYSGFIAAEPLYEVARHGDSSDGSWMVPVSRADPYPDDVFVLAEDEETGAKQRVRYPAGSFVYRLAGRDREASASYYTPESLTKVTVELALRHRLDQDGETPARDLLSWRICEPALGSGAFLNEAINQVAAEYLRRRERETGAKVPGEDKDTELRKVKAYLALHNCYGVDLNDTAVELAEVSLWLNVMHPGLQAPWFGLHLWRGNSLIGAGRRVYDAGQLTAGAWLRSKDAPPPADHPFTAGALPDGAVHHFLLPATGWGSVAAEREAKDLAPEDAAKLAAWRRGVLKAPKKGTRRRAGQAERLQALARRAEALWEVVIRRLRLSEAEISRHIDVWEAGELPRAIDPMPREKVVTDLTAPGTPYWRLKKLMNVWCALWFWPVQHAALLDGSAATYDRPYNPNGRVPRPVVPLATLDDWIEFAEALIGAADLDPDTLLAVRIADNLDDVALLEDELPDAMGMLSDQRLGDRFPWLGTAEDIAEERGFFHWELQFAHVFADGGFDLQLGNPPWFRPEWKEADVLAEREPWFKLTDNAPAEEWRRRKARLLEAEEGRDFFLAELAGQSAMSAFFASPATYPLLAGTRPDLYRVFMLRTWANTGPHGTVGLLHPDSHFTGDKERRLRAAAYARLRVHGDFMNAGNRFFPPPLSRTMHFGLHIYRRSNGIEFAHLSWLFATSALTGSLDDEGGGDLPGVKYHGHWDARPHPTRVIEVDPETLGKWRRLTGDADVPAEEVKLLNPVSTEEQGAIVALGEFDRRLVGFAPRISQGYNETTDVHRGLIRWELCDPEDWSEAILKGPQLGVATPIFKQPPNTGTKGRPQDLALLPVDALPRSEYRRATDLTSYREAQDRWVDYRLLTELLASPEAVEDAQQALAAVQGMTPDEIQTEQVEGYLADKARRRYTEFYRVAWREMIATNTDRSLFPVLVPPGPAHIHAVRSMALSTSRETALVAGFWAGLPLDYLLRTTGTSHLDVVVARTMPAPDPEHPLATALLLRTLRLNCLTEAYADLWAELYENAWRDEGWVVDWSGVTPLGDVGPNWEWAAPLRTEMARRAALVEIDALVAVWLGLTAEQLATIYRSRFPVLYDYENATWFDADGRKIAGNWNAYGHGQTKEHYAELLAHLDNPADAPPPDGYRPPFYRADREAEMRRAHAVFTDRISNLRPDRRP